jgi:hypothetical protein
VPFGLSAISAQTAEPVAQEIAPTLQAFVVTVQALPAAHATHAPSLHTMPVLQTMPFGCASRVSVHDAVPVAEQVVCPT